MSIGIAILSGYICLSTHATAVPLGAGAPPALSVIFHPSTKSLTLSAALTKSSLGMNSYSNFMPSFLLFRRIADDSDDAHGHPFGQPSRPNGCAILRSVRVLVNQEPGSAWG